MIFLLGGIILCIVGCLVTSVSCPFRIPVTLHPYHKNQKCLQTLINVWGRGCAKSALVENPIELLGSLITHTYLLAVDAFCSNRLSILKLLIHTCPGLILYLPTVGSRQFQDTAVPRTLMLAKDSTNDVIGGWCFILSCWKWGSDKDNATL